AVSNWFVDTYNKKLFSKKTVVLRRDKSLSHISFYGVTPPQIQGVTNTNFYYGGETMEFATTIEPTSPGDKLHYMIVELMGRPSYVDRSGNRVDTLKMTYADAFAIISAENPELTEQYQQSILPKRTMNLSKI
ncbi:MAG: hypothetical protein WCQ99_09795, partial [Pseudomonadota bacterium]